MSIKGDIYKAIADQLKEQIPEIIWIDKDRNQFEHADQEFLPLPAVLISFPRAEFETKGAGLQTSTAIIAIRTGFENYAQSFEGSTDQDQALEFWEFNRKVYNALQGFSGDNFSGMVRISEDEDPEQNNVIPTRMEFVTTIQDYSNSRREKYSAYAGDDVGVEKGITS